MTYGSGIKYSGIFRVIDISDAPHRLYDCGLVGMGFNFPAKSRNAYVYASIKRIPRTIMGLLKDLVTIEYTAFILGKQL